MPPQNGGGSLQSRTVWREWKRTRRTTSGKRTLASTCGLLKACVTMQFAPGDSSWVVTCKVVPRSTTRSTEAS
jgi:hypothetical protein